MRVHLLRPRVLAAATAAVCVSGAIVGAGGPAPGSAPDVDRARITHVLDRIAFGARPGDVDRVAAMGLDAYIDQQLHPERIDDHALDARLAEFPTLSMSSRDLAARYFMPAQALKRNPQVKQQVASARTARSAATSPTANAGSSASGADPADPNEMMMTPGARPAPNGPAAAAGDASIPPELRQARQAAQTVVSDLMQAKMLRAATSDRQLEEVLTDFWFNHFNVFIGKNQVRDYLTSYERDTIRPHVLGSFRDLLGAVAHSPAMLFYLDNWQSAAANSSNLPPQAMARLIDPRIRPDQRERMLQRLEQARAQAKRQPRGLNENYAREIMELHTLGVDGGYTQQDVIELARILTGWTIDRPQQGGGFIFRPEMHDQGTKTFLGVTFKADGEREGERALDMLAAHPSTAHHIAYELAQRFVADEPPAALVDRAASAFTRTKGDLREVVKVIITSPEFFADDAYRAKVKTPFEFVVSAVRATGATVNNAQPLVVAMRNLGMPLYGCQPPTGYSMTADAWVNTGSLLGRMNLAVQLVSGGRITPAEQPGRGGGGAGARAAARPAAALQGPGPGPGGRGRGALAARFGGPIVVDLASLAPDTSEAARANLVQTLLAGRASAATEQTLARAQTPQTLVALALGSPEFQRR